VFLGSSGAVDVNVEEGLCFWGSSRAVDVNVELGVEFVVEVIIGFILLDFCHVILRKK
jgi:hypothetical protein